MTPFPKSLSCWFAAGLSALAMVLIVQMWRTVDHETSATTTVIANQTQLDTFFDTSNRAATAENFKSEEQWRIPTGLFIQSSSFDSSTDVNLTGYIWQHFPEGFPFTRGFTFPEEVDSRMGVIEEAYSEPSTYNGEPHELIGWRFDVTVRQSFDYTSYPLDYLNIWLRIWPEDWSDHANIVLVPDFQNYDTQGKPTFGLDGDIVQGEWQIVDTFFSDQSMPYDTNFGIQSRDKDTVFNEFFYNLAVERKFINAFIINLVPLLIVSLLLFSTVMTISGRKEQASVFGFSATGVIGTCSAMFFVVLLSHIQIRGLFANSGLVYIEYFYLVLYCMILLVALNGYLFSLTGDQRIAVLHWQDNFIAKVSFWPLLLWALALVTWVVL